jgi:hypothetical protein
MKHTLRKYISAEEVFNRASSSLSTYFDADMIISDYYYKVIDLCNASLGLRINPSKEALISLDNYTAELPDDFLLLELALIVDTASMTYNIGTSKVETLTGECPTAQDITDSLDKCCNFKLQCGKKPVLTCTIENHSIEFQETYIARLTEKKHCSSDCFNLNSTSPYMMEITDNQIFVDSIQKAKLYIIYTAKMSNGDNIPNCLDNPIIMEYYEQAIVYRMLKDMYINKKADVGQALQLVRQEYINAKNAAINLASTPEFNEMISVNNALKRHFRKRNYIL